MSAYASIWREVDRRGPSTRNQVILVGQFGQVGGERKAWRQVMAGKMKAARLSAEPDQNDHRRIEVASKIIPNEHYAKAPCQACGKTFHQTHHAQKVCSVKCRAKYEAQLEKEKSDEEVALLAERILAKIQADIRKKKKAEPAPKPSRTDNMISPRLRFIVLSRDGFKCAYCGRSAHSDGVKLAVDHISPWARTYDHSESNLITACEECNAGKSDREIPAHLKEAFTELVNRRIAQDDRGWRPKVGGK